MGRGKKVSRDELSQLAAIIGAGARTARNELQMTQGETAEQVGITAEFYARIERGHALPSVPTFHNMISVLQVSADELLGLKDATTALGSPEHQLLLPNVSANPAARLSFSPGISQAPDPPALKRIKQRLQDASPATLRLISMLTQELEVRFIRAAKKSDKDEDDDEDDDE